jgi:CubicO group peptidase (beta-lactamase class C family)
MGALDEELSSLQDELRDGIERYGVPGASIGVMRGDERVFAAAGVLNQRTGIEATPESVFQIGSITKTFTTTLVMQLVDDGRIELDAPVRTYLPTFALADPTAAARITVRHLLTHTSGLDGDFFQDTGRGDDCLERYALACSALPQLHEPGDGFSYCNAGFAILGRIIERLTGDTWDNVLRERLLAPIGTTTMVTLPEDAITMRVAAGHLPGKEGLRVARLQLLPRSNGPAGSTPFATTADLLSFARLHLDGGTAAGGTRVLSAASVEAMQTPQYTFEPAQDPAQWGLGWMLFDWGGERLFGHDGGTIGQSSFLRILPSKGIGVALLTNGGQTGMLYRELFGSVFEKLAGIAVPPVPPATEGMAFDASRYVGRYERLSQRIDVAATDDGLEFTVTPLTVLVPGTPAQTMRFRPVDDERFVSEPTKWTGPVVAAFGRFDSGGRATTLTSGFRLHPRVSEA